MQVNIFSLEQAINKCSKETSTKNFLSPPGEALSEIYGLMIYEKKKDIDFQAYLDNNVFNIDHVKALEQFYDSES